MQPPSCIPCQTALTSFNQDYPPSTTFHVKFEEYDDNFQRGVPMASYSAADGFDNLAAHFPSPAAATFKTAAAYIQHKPDIGM